MRIPGKAPDVETQEKYVQKIIQTVEDTVDTENVALFLDPMHQIHNSETGYSWQIRGKEGTKTILANTGRRRLNIIGALNPVDLQTVTLLTEDNCDQEMIKAFLDQVKKTYPDAPKITIFLDNAKYNVAYEVQEKAADLGIVLSFLPPYSPNLNLIERLWKFFKKTIIKDTYYPNFGEFYQAIYDFFGNIEEYYEQLKTLITLKFQIIKAS